MEIGLGGRDAGGDDHVPAGPRLKAADALPQATADSVPHDRVAQAFAGGEPVAIVWELIG